MKKVMRLLSKGQGGCVKHAVTIANSGHILQVPLRKPKKCDMVMRTEILGCHGDERECGRIPRC